MGKFKPEEVDFLRKHGNKVPIMTHALATRSKVLYDRSLTRRTWPASPSTSAFLRRSIQHMLI